MVAALGMSLTSFIGALASVSTAGLVAATAVAGYACGTIGQINPIASTVALNSFVAFILFSSRPLSPAAAAQESLLVLAGGAIQALLVLVAWPFARGGAERSSLADVYLKLASYAREIAEGSPAFPPLTPLATARQVLADPQPFARSGEVARLGRLLEDSEIIRRRLGALGALAERTKRPAIAALARGVAGQLESVAAILQGRAKDAQLYELPPEHRVLELAGADDLADHLRDATEAALMIARRRLPRVTLLSKPRPAPYVENHVDWLARESIRFAVVLAIAMALGRHFAAERGYWIPMTAAIVLRPDFETTFVRGFGRIAGTMAGAVVATLLIALINADPWAATGAILVAAATAYVSFNPNYALFTVAITSFVAVVLHMRGLPGTTTIADRLIDTLAGGTLAMVGYLAFPSVEHERTRALLADLLDAQRHLAVAILRAYAAPSPEARAAIEAGRTDLWKIRTKVEASIDRTAHEPHSPHTIGAVRALRILSASQRVGLASLALETALETMPHIALDGLGDFTDALDRTMAELAEDLRRKKRARPDRRVQAALERLETEAAGDADDTRRLLIARLRDFAHASARIARLVGVSP